MIGDFFGGNFVFFISQLTLTHILFSVMTENVLWISYDMQSHRGL